MIQANNPKLKALLILHEGVRLTTYRCPGGKMTIGVGHNLEANPILGLTWGSTITTEQAYDILEKDLAETIYMLESYIDVFHTLDIVRQAVLVDMAFNLGVAGLKKFRGFLARLGRKDWEGAEREMFNSRWAFQVGDGPGKKFDRVDRLAQMIRTGEWP